jgi:hypothetical protein
MHYLLSASPSSKALLILAITSVPASFELIKTLIYKLKTAKSATPIPVIVISRAANASSAATSAGMAVSSRGGGREVVEIIGKLNPCSLAI